jgi:ectoine hydroxylase-related dioxygenase (phytanoyl-CoA dioxygenase family)
MSAAPFAVEEYRRDGYAIVRGIVGPARLEELCAEADRLGDALAEAPARWGSHVDWERDHVEPSDRDLAGLKIARIEPLIDLSDIFAELSCDPRVTAPAEAIFGDGVALFEDKLNLKLPGGAGFPWHQDWSCCWRAHTDELVTCFVALDDATEENGPLQVIPGSHHPRTCLPFRGDAENIDDPAFRAKTEGFEVDPAAVDAASVVRATLGAGDMVVFDPYLLHASDRNVSDRPRRTIIYTYHPARLGRLYEYRDVTEERAAAAARVRARIRPKSQSQHCGSVSPRHDGR